jgi:hypothetical protein
MWQRQALQELSRTIDMEEILERAQELLRKIVQLEEHL